MLRTARTLLLTVVLALSGTLVAVVPSATAAPTTYQAESAALSGGAVVGTDHSGFTGTGFVGGYTDANKGNAATSFNVTATSAGTATATIRYANGTGATMSLSVYVNGTKIRQSSLPPVGTWNTWGTKDEALTLRAGTNTVTYRFDSSDLGNVNLDHLVLTGGGGPTDPPGSLPYEMEGGFVSGGAVVASAISGFNGTGYVSGFTTVGARAIRTVNQAAAGNAVVTLHYNNTSGGARTLSTYANGLKSGQIPLPSGSGWRTATHTLPLRAGLNLIGYQYDAGDSGGVALDGLSVAGSLELNARGATVPYTEYEAESGSTNATVIGPDRTYRTIASESSGRRAVRLDNAGKYTQLTLTKAANSIVVRYSIPDGTTAPLALYANNVKVKDLPLTSTYSWVYGDYPFPNDPALGGGHRFYDEVRSTLPTYPAGTVLKLQNETATPITVDLVDTEVVAPAFTAPAGAVHITSHGATSGGGDDTAAINAAISAARSQGGTVWIPAGTFDVTSRINLSGVTVRGAGMWHSTVRGNNGRGGFYAAGGNVQLADFTFAGDVRYRDADGVVTTDAAMEGNFGTGSLIHNVWVEHSKVGLWANGGTNGLYMVGVRIRNTFADGVNLNNAVSDTRVDQSVLRNTGDDALAMWSHTTPVTNSAFTFNTATLPMLASTSAIYGGNGNRIEDNLFADTVYTATGVTISTWHQAQPFSGTTVVQRNTLTRTGGWNNDWASSQGAVWIYAQSRDITAPVLVKDLTIVDSSYQAILLSWQRTITNLTLDHITITGAGTYGIEANAAGSATANHVTVTGAASGGLNNATGYTFIRGPGNSGW